MKGKVANTKGKKRSLSETSVSIKSEKQENVSEFKGFKKAKPTGIKQNGSPASGQKAPLSKVEQNKNQNRTIKQQSNIVPSLETKRDKKEKIELTAVKPKKRTNSSRQKKRNPYIGVNFTAEQMTKKIAEIRSREVLSKRSKKILNVLERRLRECGNNSEKLGVVGKKSNKKAEHRKNVLIKNEQKANEDKRKAEKKHVQSKGKPYEEDDSDVEEDDEDMDVEEESLENESDESKPASELIDSLINKKIKKEDDSVEDEENEEDEDEEELESEEEEVETDEDEEIESEEDGELEEDEEGEESDEDEEEIENKNKQEPSKNKQEQNKNKQEQNKKRQVPQFLDNQQKGEKKKRYVLFVGNLPLDITEDEIKQHFLTKIDTITSIRIPTKPDKTPRGFAYVEVTNNVDFEKGLSFNQTFLKKRRINVQYSLPAGHKKADNATKKFVVAKNMKLQALQKAGKLAGGNQKQKLSKKEN